MELEDQADNPDKQLIRFEFIELLVRIANDKYLRNDRIAGGARAQTITEAFELLIEENVPKGSRAAEWQGFRDNSLWCVDVNDVLEANLDLLRKVYKSYTSPVAHQMSLDGAIDLLANKADNGMNDRDALYCYGMSKMTVVDENNDSKRYDSLVFVEFLEMVCRAANLKFSGSELESIALARKVEHILDDIFAPFHLRRRGVRVEIAEETESDSDY